MEITLRKSSHFLFSTPPPSNSPISNSPQILSFSSPKPRLLNFSKPLRTTRTSFSRVRMSTVDLEPSLALKNKAYELSEGLKGTSIFLVGINCTMKTNLGKLLADALRYYYFDSDSLVQQAVSGMSAAKSLNEINENDLRDSETEVLKQLSSMGRLVVCAGDGAVQSSTNLAFLRYGISISVFVPLDKLANEVLNCDIPSPARKAISHSDSFPEVLEELSKQYARMREGYGTADATVSLQKVASALGYEDLDSVTPQDMAMEVLVSIEKLTRVKKMMEAAARPF